ncbi:MAG: alpha-L-rhamnosidase N-terminal domain-containing protein [Melioribacteraceae bacterium]
MKKIIILISAIILVTNMSAQESTVTKNHQGKEFTMLKHAWKAQWITHPTESTLDYGVFLFRRTFELKKKPSQFKVYVSADNRYRLYVNGKQVCFGPSVGDINHQRYETIDIVDELQEGPNVIAAEVVNFGEYRKASQQTFQTAFILQGDPTNEVDINTGSTDWKVIKNNAYSVIPFTSDSLKTYYAAGPCDRVDDSKYPWDWQSVNYDDNNWLKPKKATVEFAVGRGFLYGSTWFLVPRTIPFMEESFEPFIKIARTYCVDADEEFLKGNESLTIPKNSKVTILIDQTYHTTGFPELTYSKGSNSKIKITYAEALIKEYDGTEPLSDGNNISVDLKGDRNNIKGKSIFGYYDIVLPDGGEKRFFKPLSRRTYRFIQLDIETANEELVLNKYHGVYTGYPFEEKAKFRTDDKFLAKVWENSWRTLRNSAEESFFDPYFEQLQYIGDTRIEALISIYVSGDDRLMRKAIEQFDDSRISDGLTQSRYPSYIVQVIPTYSLLWIDMIHDYFMYRDDPKFVQRFMPGMISVLEWFNRKIDDTGMLTNLEWWNFTDWTIDYPNGIPHGADDGYSANIALQYSLALKNALDIFGYFGMDDEFEKYSIILSKVKSATNEKCFVKEKGLFSETPDQKLFSQHTNIFAILSDALPKENQKELMEKILDDSDLIQSTIYFKFYLFRALQKAGLGDKYLEMLQPWNTMIDNGMTTFGETDINPRSECHAWSASPNFDFLHTVAGIYPAEPGFKSVVIEPNFSYLSYIDVEMPHPKGLITVKLSKDKSDVKGIVFLPSGITGTFKWNGKEINLKEGEQKISL